MWNYCFPVKMKHLLERKAKIPLLKIFSIHSNTFFKFPKLTKKLVIQIRPFIKQIFNLVIFDVLPPLKTVFANYVAGCRQSTLDFFGFDFRNKFLFRRPTRFDGENPFCWIAEAKSLMCSPCSEFVSQSIIWVPSFAICEFCPERRIVVNSAPISNISAFFC